MAATLEATGIGAALRPTGTWAAALVSALARDEAAGRRPQRLTEPRMATWSRFRGRMTATDLLALLFEDAAVLHHMPFDPTTLDPSLRIERIPSAAAQAWLDGLQHLDLQADSAEYIAAQARLLGISTRLARSDLHVVKPHQKVLELPGTGGQLAHHLASSQSDLTLRDNFSVACSSWQELTLAGIVALDLGAPETSFVVGCDVAELRDPGHELRQRRFDFVVGLHPDKGGLFRVEDQLALWFPDARILLV